MNHRLIAFIEVIGAGIAFGFLGIFAKQLYAEGLSIGEVLSFRFIVAAVLLGMYFLMTNPKLFLVTKRQLLMCLAQGVFGYALFASFYFKAIEGVSVPLAAMLLFTYPVVIHLIAFLLKLETLSLRQWLSLPLVIIGLALALWGEIEIKSWWAVASGFAASVSYSLYVLASNHYQKNIKAMTANFYVILSAAVALFIAYQVNPQRALEFNFTVWKSIFGLAFICSILAMILFLKGLQKLRASEAAIVSTVEPIAAIILSVILLGQDLTLQSILGTVLIIGAVIIVATAQQEAN